MSTPQTPEHFAWEHSHAVQLNPRMAHPVLSHPGVALCSKEVSLTALWDTPIIIPAGADILIKQLGHHTGRRDPILWGGKVEEG